MLALYPQASAPSLLYLVAMAHRIACWLIHLQRLQLQYRIIQKIRVTKSDLFTYLGILKHATRARGTWRKFPVVAMLAALGSFADVPLVSFDGAIPLSKFVQLNDPVMGGRSSGSWSVDAAGKFGTFNGTVLDVPSLSAPGFIKAAADGAYPDASGAAAGDLVLMVRSSTPSYTGFKVSFASGTAVPPYACAGGGAIPFSRGCFKAPFTVPAGDAFTAVRVPFHAFSDRWSPSTGKQTTTCAASAGHVCRTPMSPLAWRELTHMPL